MKRLLILTILMVALLQVSYLHVTVKADSVATATYIIRSNSTSVWAVAENGTDLWTGTNATYTIQSAFANLPENGGTVHLAAGDFSIQGLHITNKASINDYPDQEIIFEGEGEFISTLQLEDNAPGATSILNKTNVYAMVFVEPFDFNDGIRFTIQNIGFDGNRINQRKDIAGIAVRDDFESVIQDNYFYMCGGHGIMNLGSRNLRESYVRRNVVYFTDSCGASPADPGTPLESYLAGIVWWKQDSEITDNTVGWVGMRGNTTFKGIGICGATNDIERNRVWGTWEGIVMSNAFFYIVSENFVDSAEHIGIFLYNAYCGSVLDNPIVRVAYDNPSEANIEIGGNSSDNTIKANKIYTWANCSSSYGIFETDNADYNIITDNDIMKDPKHFVAAPGILENDIGVILTPIKTAGEHTIAYDNNYDFSASNTSSGIDLKVGQWAPLISILVAFATLGMTIKLRRRSRARALFY